MEASKRGFIMFKEINVDSIVVSDLNVRKTGINGLRELADNIKEMAAKFKNDGLIHALTVRKAGKKYEVVSGQRRLRAIQLLNDENEKGNLIDKVKCMVITGSKDKDVLLSLSENVFNQQMDAIDRFKAYSTLVEKGYTIAKIAQAFGTSSHSVNQSLAIANLLDEVIELWREDQLREDVFKYMTTLSHDQQKLVVDAIKNENVAIYNKSSVNDLVNRKTIDSDCALFDLDKSGIAITTDLFSEKSFVTDYSKFMDLQRQAINEKLDAHKENHEIALFYDTDQSFNSWRFCKWEDEEDIEEMLEENCFPVHVYSLDSNGECSINVYGLESDEIYSELVLKGEIVEEKEEEDDSDDVSDENAVVTQSSDPDIKEKPVRQELTSSDQEYFSAWRHLMVAAEMTKDHNNSSKIMLAMLVSRLSFDVKNSIHKVNIEDEQLQNSEAFKTIKDFEEKIGDFIGMEYGSRIDFDEAYVVISKYSDDQIKELMTFYAIAALSPSSKVIDDLAVRLNVNANDYWKADQGFVDNLSTNPALTAVAGDLIESEVDQSAFSNMKIKEKKIKLASVLRDDYVPNYFQFPIQKYGPTELTIEPKYW